MKQGELQQLLTGSNPWWRSSDWERDDPDLSRSARAPFNYEPQPLSDIRPDGVYFLRGPRRVGKSVEVKRTIASLIRHGVDPRLIVHFACNGLEQNDLKGLVLAAQRLSAQVPGARYWFLDEITAARKGWEDAIAFLRDNNAGFRDDCVVLTGSSTRDLDSAVKALADRRGQLVLGDDRLLLPMGFRQFCRIAEPSRSFPQPEALHPHEFATDDWHNAAYELAPFLNDTVALWELYLTIGGFPTAVRDFIERGSVSDNFVTGVWQVIYGEAIRSKAYSTTQIQRLLAELTQRLTSVTNFTQLAEDCAFSDHSVASDRCDDLIASYIVWPCYSAGPGGLPALLSQRKFYFYDPLLARLAHLLDNRNPAPDVEVVSEQQLGLTLLRAVRGSKSTTPDDYSSVLFFKTPSRNEIDFVGPRFDPAAFESKYIDTKKTNATAPLKSKPELKGIMASRAFLDIESSVPWLPTSFIVWLLEQPV